MQLLLPVGRRSSRCGLSPCVTSAAPSSLLGCNCVPRRAGLGWEDNSAQLLCLTWGFSSLPHLHPKEGVVPVPPMSRSDSAPQSSAMGCPAGMPSLAEAASPSAQAMPGLFEIELQSTLRKSFAPCPMALSHAGCVTSVSQRCLAGAGGAAAALGAQPGAGLGMQGMEMRSGFLPASDSRTWCYLPRISCRVL